MWYSFAFFDPDDDMMAIFFGHARGGTRWLGLGRGPPHVLG
jgi:hypothetical protein